MAATITLTFTEGNRQEHEYVFAEPVHCVIGRADDCTIQLPKDIAHADISRHHCLLDIAPPTVRVRDLGSRNGTFVNGERIGQRPRYQPPEAANLDRSVARALEAGDEIRVGHTIVRVGVHEAGV